MTLGGFKPVFFIESARLQVCGVVVIDWRNRLENLLLLRNFHSLMAHPPPSGRHEHTLLRQHAGPRYRQTAGIQTTTLTSSRTAVPTVKQEIWGLSAGCLKALTVRGSHDSSRAHKLLLSGGLPG
jgi:hypothetical protein